MGTPALAPEGPARVAVRWTYDDGSSASGVIILRIKRRPG